MRTPLLLVFAVGCSGNVDGGGGGGPDAAVNATAHQFCVQETNRYRTMNSRAAVQESAQLESYADTGAMVDFNAQPHDHFKQSPIGGGIAFAENECPHWDLQQQGGGDMKQLVAACIAAFYSEGPGGGHYENMLGNYGTLGCGIFQSGSSVTLVQDYGQ